MSQERDSVLLQFFWDLASLDLTARISATEKLVAYLQEKQEENEDSSTKITPQLNYTLKRLVKGLNSGREGARQGFALALTEVLSSFKVFAVKDLVEMVINETKIDKSMKSMEQRDRTFGQLFGFSTIIRAQLFKTLDSKKIKEPLTTLLQSLLLLSTKDYVYSPVYDSILVLCNQLNKSDYESIVLPLLKPVLSVGPDKYTPELVALEILLRTKFGFKVEQVSPKWGHKITHPDNLASLSLIMKESTDHHPKIHFSWDYLTKEFFGVSLFDADYSTDAEINIDNAKKFWNTVVDEALFTSSDQRKYLGLQLFSLLMPRLVKSGHLDRISFLLSPNLTFLLVANLKTKKSGLYTLCSKVVESMISAVRGNRKASMLLVAQLNKDGKRNFDHMTGTKTVQTLQEGEKEDPLYLEQLFSTILENTISSNNDHNDDEDQSNDADDMDIDGDADDKKSAKSKSLTRIYLEELTKKLKSSKPSSDMVNKVLHTLLLSGFFKSSSSSSSGEIVNKKTSKPLESILGHAPKVITVPDCLEYAKTAYLDLLLVVTTNDNSLGMLEQNLKLFDSIKKVSGLEEVSPVSDEFKPVETSIRSTLDSIDKQLSKSVKDQAVSQRLKVFRYLFSGLLLLAHAGLKDLPEQEIIEISQDLFQCYETVVSSKSSKNSKKKSKKEEEDEEEPDPVNVLVDIFIELSTKTSVFVHAIVNHAFKLLANDLTASSFQLLLDAISGEVDIEAEGAEDDGHDHDDDEDSEDDSEDDDDDEEDEEEEEEKPQPKRKATETSSKKPSKKKESDSEEEEEESDSEDDSDDDGVIIEEPDYDATQIQMIDAQLKDMNDRLDQRERAQLLTRAKVEWRLRLLGLVETYLIRRADKIVDDQFLTSNFVVCVVKILIDASSPSKILRKIEKILDKQVFVVKSIDGTVSKNIIKNIQENLAELWQMALRKHTDAQYNHPEKSPKLAEAISFYGRILLKSVDEKQEKSVKSSALVEPTKEALDAFFHRKLSGAFIVTILKRFPWLGWDVMNDILEQTAKVTKGFVKREALNFIPLIFQNHELLKSHSDHLATQLKTILKIYSSMIAKEGSDKRKKLKATINRIAQLVQKHCPASLSEQFKSDLQKCRSLEDNNNKRKAPVADIKGKPAKKDSNNQKSASKTKKQPTTSNKKQKK